MFSTQHFPFAIMTNQSDTKIGNEPTLSHSQFIEVETAIIDKKNQLYKATLVLPKGTHLFHDGMFHVTGLKVKKYRNE